MTCDELLDEAAEPARVDRSGIKLPGGIRSEQHTNQYRRQVGVLLVPMLAIRQAVEEAGQLRNDFLIQSCQAFAQLRTAERRDLNLGEQDAAVAIGRVLDEEKVEPARECSLGIEHVELGAQRRAEVLDDLFDGRNQEVFLRHEVVVHESRRKIRLGCDPLDRRVGDAVLQHRGAQALDDLAATRSGETRSSHR